MDCVCKNIEILLVEYIATLGREMYGSDTEFAKRLFPDAGSPKQKWYWIQKGQKITIEEACRACQLLETEIYTVLKQCCMISKNKAKPKNKPTSIPKEIKKTA